MKYALLTFALMLNLGSAHAAGDAEAGGKLFAKTCGGCHSIGEGARGGFGPELNGIIGRPAGTTAELKPGGHHLMFIQPTRALPAGEQVDATLVFERAGRMPVVFEVRPLGAAAPKPHQ